MARIGNYTPDTNVTKDDKLFGTDSGGATKNYRLEEVSTFFKETNAAGVAAQLTYKYDTTVGQASGYLDSPSTTDFTANTTRTIRISDYDHGNSTNTRSNLINALLNQQIIFLDTADQNNFGIYTITNITSSGNYKTLTLSIPIASNGSMISGKAYAIANYASSGDITAVTSATTNQLTIANGTGPEPALSIVTGAVADSGTALATSDQIYDFVTTGTLTLTNKTLTNPTLNAVRLSQGSGNVLLDSKIFRDNSGSTDGHNYFGFNGDNVFVITTNNQWTISATSGTAQLRHGGNIKLQTHTDGIQLHAGLIIGTGGTLPVVTAIQSSSDSFADNNTSIMTSAAIDDRINSAILTKDNTDEITEGSSNLYFTNARADARITAALIDEDDMASNSATRLPSQQSVKAYADLMVPLAGGTMTGNITISNATPKITFIDTNTNADARIHADSSNGSFAIDADFNNESNPTKVHIKTDGKEVGYFRGDSSQIGSLRLFPEKNDNAAQGIFFGTAASGSNPGVGAFTDTRVISMSSGNVLFLYPTSNTAAANVPLAISSNGSIQGTSIKDEDNMSSNSATHLATQQSIKAYVDTQVQTKDTLAELTDVNLTSPADASLLIYDTGTSTWRDAVLSGDITINDTGVVTIGTGATSLDELSDVLVGNNSMFIGEEPSSATSNAIKNVSVGIDALEDITDGIKNVAVGYQAGMNITTGSTNIAIGQLALANVTTDSTNIAIGDSALEFIGGGTVSHNIGIGQNAMKQGGTNVSYNVAIGTSALYKNLSGNHNIAIGYNAGHELNFSDTNGSNNILIGSYTGSATYDLHDGDNNVLIGHQASASSVDNSDVINSIAIGYQVVGGGDNTVTLGNADITVWLPGDDNGVDLGSVAKSFKDAHIQGVVNAGSLDVAGDADIDGTLETDALTIGGVTSVPFEAADHSKLDAIEASANVTDTANVTSAGALMDSEVTDLAGIKSVTISTLQVKPSEGAFANGDKTKLDGIEASATADQTNAEIRTAVEAASDSNVFTDADHSKLNAIEASATADQTNAEIRAAVEAATDSNVFTDADHTKLNAIEASADVTDTTNVTAAGALMDSELTNLAAVKAINQGLTTSSNVSFGNITTTGYLRGPASFTIDPAAHGDNTGTLVIAGNLQVDGTTTTINSTTVAIDDLNFSIATDAADSAAANGAGITIGGAGATMLYTHATTSFDFNKPVNVTGAFSASGNITGNLVGNVTGNVSGTAATVTGAAQSAITSLGTLTTLTVDDITINGSEISDSSSLTIDTEGDFIVESTNIRLRVNGTENAILADANAGVTLYYDSNARISATNAGATVTGTLTVNSGHVNLDAGMSLSWDDTHERIEQSDGHLEFFINNGEAMTLDTNGLGIGTTAPDQRLHLSTSATSTAVYQKFTNGTTGTSGDNGTTLGIDADGDFLINNQEAKEIKFYTSDAGPRLTIAAGGDATFTQHVALADSKEIRLGAGTDLKLYSNGTDGYVVAPVDDLVLQSADDVFIYTQGGEDAIIARGDAGVELFYNNSKKFETTNTGAIITGTLSTSGGSISLNGGNFTMGDKDGSISGKIMLGNSADLQIYHDGNHSYIDDNGTGGLYIRTNSPAIYLQDTDGNYMAQFTDGGAVFLAHNANTKFQTTSTGVTVTGNIVFGDNHFIGNGSGDDLSIQSSTGEDIYLDSAGDIILDADGGDVMFRDGGTGFIQFTHSSGDAVITSNVDDEDIIFKGYDGGSLITALTLDMSDGGWATFNSGIHVANTFSPSTFGKATFAGNVTLNGDGKLLKFTPTSYDDVELGIDSNGFVIYNTTDSRYDLKISGTGNATFGGTITSGNITTQSRITFDYGGDHYMETGTNTLSFKASSGSVQSTFNFSDLSTTFAGNILMGNTVVNPASGFSDQTGIGLKYSTTVPELQVSSDSTAMQLGRTSTGGSGQIMAMRAASTTVHDFRTTYYSTTGWVDATNYKINGAQGSDGQVLTSTGSGVAWEDATGGSSFTGGTVANATTFSSAVGIGAAAASGMLDVKGADTDNAVIARFYSATGSRGRFIIRNGSGTNPTTFIGTGGGSEQLSIGTNNIEAIRLDASQNATFAGDVTAGESQNAASFIKATNTNSGTSATARFQAVGESSQIDIIATSAGYTGVSGWGDVGAITTDSGASGGLILNAVTGGVRIQTGQTTALTINGSGVATFEKSITMNTGSFTVNSDAGKIYLGADDDMQIYHDGTNAYINNSTGILNVTNDDFRLKTSGAETMLRAVANGAVEIMYDNSTKLATVTGGVNVTGGLSIGGTEVINSARNLLNITNLVVDGVDIGGNDITVASGDFALNVDGDITFDAGGGDILLKDDGTLVGTIGGFASNNVNIKNEVSDGDITFQGVDGGSGITALTLDMSAGGNATFAGAIIQSMGNPYTKMIDTSSGGDDYGLNNNESKFSIYNWTDGREELYFGGDGNATFSGTITGTALASTGGLTIADHMLMNYGNEIRTKDSANGVRTVLRASSNKLQYGWSYGGKVEFMGGSAYSPKITIDTNGKVGIGTARGGTDPDEQLHVAGENNGYDGTLKVGERAIFAHRDAGQTKTFLANNYNHDSATFGIRMKGVADSNEVMTITGAGNTTFTGSVRAGTYFTAETANHAYIRFKHGSGSLNYVGSSESLTGAFGDENDMLNYTDGKWGVYTSSTLALTLDESQNATFAGTISSGAITSSGRVTGTQGYFGDCYMHTDGGYAVYGSDASNVPIAIALNGTASSAALKIETNNNATFAGKIITTSTGSSTIAAIQLAGNAGLGIAAPATDQLNFITADLTALTLDSSQNAIFSEHVAILDGNELQFGGGGDFKIWHAAGENTYLRETGEGATVFQSNGWYFQNTASPAVTKMHLSDAGDATFAGNVSHTGLTPTAGTDVDQIYTTTKSLTVTTSWQDTGIDATDLATGTYIIQMYTNDHGTNSIGHYDEYYSGIMSWYSSNTNATGTDEIILHRAGHAANHGDVFLRVERTLSADANDMHLQIKTSNNASGAANYVFKFRRMI